MAAAKGEKTADCGCAGPLNALKEKEEGEGVETPKEAEKGGGGEDDAANGAGDVDGVDWKDAKPALPPPPAEPNGAAPKVKAGCSGDWDTGANGCAEKEEVDAGGAPNVGEEVDEEPKVKGVEAGAEVTAAEGPADDVDAPKVKGAAVEVVAIVVGGAALEGAENKDAPPKVNRAGVEEGNAEDVDGAEEAEEDANGEVKLNAVEGGAAAVLEAAGVDGAAGKVNDGAVAALDAPKVKTPGVVDAEAPNIGADAVDDGKENIEEEEEEEADTAPVEGAEDAPKVKGTLLLLLLLPLLLPLPLPPPPPPPSDEKEEED